MAGSSGERTRIELSWRNREAPMFSLRPPMRVFIITFYDETSTEQLWTLVSGTFAPVYGEVIGGKLRRIEPTNLDIDHIASDAVRDAGVLISQVLYGTIPVGLQQVWPKAGEPIQLTYDGSYTMLVVGSDTIRTTFDGRGGVP